MPQLNDFSWSIMLLYFFLFLLSNFVKFWSLMDFKASNIFIKMSPFNMFLFL